MMKTNIRKYLVLACCAVLLVCMSVGATLAYLTSTDSVENTFTVGNVKITLDEAKVDANGNAVTPAARVKANSYKLLPGHTYTKDPTVHIDAASEEAYLRLVVEISNAAATDALLNNNPASLFTGLDVSKWTITSTVANDVRTYHFVYNQTIKGGDADIVFFTNVVVPGTLTNEQLATLNNTTIKITAQAVQKDGFTTAKAAFDATFDAQ